MCVPKQKCEYGTRDAQVKKSLIISRTFTLTFSRFGIQSDGAGKLSTAGTGVSK